MKSFKVLLHRDYIINIDAYNEEHAILLADFYCRLKRCSNRKRKGQYSFQINGIGMVGNDAFEVKEK